METKLNDRVPIKPSRHSFYLFLVILFIIVFASAIYIEADPYVIVQNGSNMFDLISRMFPPDWSYIVTTTPAMLDTIRMALLGTTMGTILSIPVMFLCARNMFHVRWLVEASRIGLNVLRTIPDLLLAAIFAAILGYSSLAGIVALSVFSVGIIAKLSFEAIENIDDGPLESMTAVGANKLQWIAFGVVPQIMPHFVSYVLYTFEINIRAAAILGLVGAGGIGLFYNRALSSFNYDQVLALILYTLVVVILIDLISLKTREKLL
ncbi:phosphonate ABC transporter, permease protein PhnE [Halalkalibacterium halodurans]|jgi:phosphonate transport system permease protein|uniref:Phosphonates transport system (Permease) n=1 Tax=Halalkalibacterium halodurans (strain ATCC BAA-125 / DSM 18197 / FERM 7344 / JCM 9153 / C-125) TaxID=272558 RepID=Q9KFN8_HALH5|nr:phosphonate ABC transporter, permease protein PhnE [Halalkalibacterium halodurans]MED4082512.1 phosphonate ABC transporter, permease protein PhnE [Halalkalibacterium halodurans]MED4085757.1 phosphonate ABC transporter, permease protein PhnE [Halalkalibacterium halodurans]MED4105623.1 phosphonate ABC transporter, permease protein PhnE [Halalkalibacterium halodurans]MED4107504.1 phosphonate ABC transporter, permease protein PhnE [Halalkalibacterium halodurans]MED4122815.1 phosphonate ABC tran